MVPKGISYISMTAGPDTVADGNAQGGGHKDELKEPFISFRWTIVYLGFLNSCVTFFVRNSFPVAVVAMANTTGAGSVENHPEDACPAVYSNTSESSHYLQSGDGEFNWSNNEQGLILGIYFWGFILSKLFGSRFGEKVGPRLTISVGTMVSGGLYLLSPLAASIGPYTLVVCRFLIGVCHGPMASANHSLLAKWSPRNELSSMVTTLFSGATFGAMAGLIAAGWLTETFGWESVFWVGGALSFLVPPVWLIIVRNTPQKHPWLSDFELKLLEENKHINSKKSVPWRKIITSPYVHICMFALFARSWLDIIFATEGPSFFRYKIGLTLSNASYVCGANYLSALLATLVFGRISDQIINRKWLSKMNTRRLFHFIGTFGAAILLVGICIANCQTATVITLWIVIGGIACGTFCSYKLSVIDIAPNYAGTVMGLMGVGNLGAAVTPIVTSALLNQGNGWNKTFYLTAIISIVSSFVYIAFMSAEAQPWNFGDIQRKSANKSERDEEKRTH